MTALLVLLTIAVFVVIELVLSRRRGQEPLASRAAGIEPMAQPFAPYGTFVATGHGWARFAADGAFLLGVDDLVTGALGAVDSIELPAPGTRLAAGEAMATLIAGGQRLVVPAPLAGEVTASNPAAIATPARVASDPYGLGWLIKVRPLDHKAALEPLHVGDGALALLRRDYRRLVDLISTASATPQMARLADGGVIERGALTRLGAPVIARFQREFLPLADAADRDEPR